MGRIRRQPIGLTAFYFLSHFVVDYVTRVTYDSGTIEKCAWTTGAMLDKEQAHDPETPRQALADDAARRHAAGTARRR
jgi:hypothetical protein